MDMGRYLMSRASDSLSNEYDSVKLCHGSKFNPQNTETWAVLRPDSFTNFATDIITHIKLFFYIQGVVEK
jgi:hypothetical protein